MSNSSNSTTSSDQYTKPQLRERIKEDIKQSDKGGKPGQWSARKAQLLKQEYEKQGGGYKGGKSDNQKSLSKWSNEEWQTKDGDANARKSDGTTKRYLPKKAWQNMSQSEKERTDQKKQQQSKQGKQFVGNTSGAKQAGKQARQSSGSSASSTSSKSKATTSNTKSTQSRSTSGSTSKSGSNK